MIYLRSDAEISHGDNSNTVLIFYSNLVECPVVHKKCFKCKINIIQINQCTISLNNKQWTVYWLAKFCIDQLMPFSKFQLCFIYIKYFPLIIITIITNYIKRIICEYMINYLKMIKIMIIKIHLYDLYIKNMKNMKNMKIIRNIILSSRHNAFLSSW